MAGQTVCVCLLAVGSMRAPLYETEQDSLSQPSTNVPFARQFDAGGRDTSQPIHRQPVYPSNSSPAVDPSQRRRLCRHRALARRAASSALPCAALCQLRHTRHPRSPPGPLELNKSDASARRLGSLTSLLSMASSTKPPYDPNSLSESNTTNLPSRL
ncbi:hypothetical protein CGMCC3_g4486 [Colletotrichum fructicola]|nr:uncharacterized protein CGMCC3_g4486 [Colletotrichum fructicola]KAE9579634.1 hypothetical protein CGMCC3_g4486 [Colletotrichum fructicola]